MADCCCPECCCCACTCGECAPCRERCTPLTASQPDQDAAQSCTSGTNSTINSLLMQGSSIAGQTLNNTANQKTLAVQAKAAAAKQKTSSMTWIVVAIIVVIGIVLLGGNKNG